MGRDGLRSGRLVAARNAREHRERKQQTGDSFDSALFHQVNMKFKVAPLARRPCRGRLALQLGSRMPSEKANEILGLGLRLSIVEAKPTP